MMKHKDMKALKPFEVKEIQVLNTYHVLSKHHQAIPRLDRFL